MLTRRRLIAATAASPLAAPFIGSASAQDFPTSYTIQALNSFLRRRISAEALNR